MASYSGEQDINRLKPVKIHFLDKDSDKEGFFSLMVSGMPVIALTDQKYIVNNVQIDTLRRKGIKYEQIS